MFTKISVKWHPFGINNPVMQKIGSNGKGLVVFLDFFEKARRAKTIRVASTGSDFSAFSGAFLIQQSLDMFGHGFGKSLVILSFPMNSVSGAGTDDASRVKECRAAFFRAGPVIRGKFAGNFYGVFGDNLPEGRRVNKRGRADHQNLRGAISGARFGSKRGLYYKLGAVGNIVQAWVKTVLEVVGTQHYNNKVQWPVTAQNWDKLAQPVAVAFNRVFQTGRPSVQAFFHNPVGRLRAAARHAGRYRPGRRTGSGVQQRRHYRRPADGRSITAAARVVTPGVGIAITKYRLHIKHLNSISSILAALGNLLYWPGPYPSLFFHTP